MDMIYEGLEYGMDFYGEGGRIIKEVSFGLDQEGKAAQDAAYAALEADPDSELWPTDAERIMCWQRPKYRQPIKGLDYGAGSVKRRFGNGRVPRGAHQFRG